MLNRSPLAAAVAMALICTHVVVGQDAGRRDAAAPRLAPTRHPPVPAELSQFWFVSAAQASRVDAEARTITSRIARGIKLINTGDFAAGLALVNTSDVSRSPLAAYAHYYAGVALTNLSRAAEADKAYTAATERRSQGYLKEAVGLLNACEDISLILNGAGFAANGRRFGSYYGYGQ